MSIKRITLILTSLSCLFLASCSALGETVEVTRVVEVPIEITRIVENAIEVTRIVEIPIEKTVLVTEEMEVTREVTRIVEVIVETTSIPSPKEPPTPTNTPQSIPTSEPQVPSLSEGARQMDQSLRNMGGMIDAALRSGSLGCNGWVNEWDYFMNLTASGTEMQYAKDVLNAWSDMTEGCREFLRTQAPGTIPRMQWGTIRQAINQALERIRPLVEG